MSNRDNRGRFKPGTSGNPKGKPKNTYTLTSLLRARAKTDYQDLVDDLWSQALSGNLKATEMILDRLEGKPEQKSKIDLGTAGGPLLVAFTGAAPPIWDEEDEPEDEDSAED